MTNYRQQQFAARAKQIEREMWEQYPEIMQHIYGSPERLEPEQTGTIRNKPKPKKQNKLIRIICRLLK